MKTGDRFNIERAERLTSWRPRRLASLTRLSLWGRDARRAGIERVLARLRLPRAYEERFQRGVLETLRPGDTVWDVGANNGQHSTAVALRVGGTGHVVCFEPGPAAFEALQARMAALDNVSLLCLALGARPGTAPLARGDDPEGATSRLSDSAPPDSVRVPVVRGSDLVADGAVRPPNVVKIDTPGSELEVLLGLGDLLDEPALRVVCIELHFGLLAARGLLEVPRRIESLLRRAGLSVARPDLCHVLAQRTPA